MSIELARMRNRGVEFSWYPLDPAQLVDYYLTIFWSTRSENYP